MCTTILIGKKASYDGSTLVARIEDSSAGMFKSKKFIVVEPKDQPIHYKSVRTDCEIELPKNRAWAFHQAPGLSLHKCIAEKFCQVSLKVLEKSSHFVHACRLV